MVIPRPARRRRPNRRDLTVTIVLAWDIAEGDIIADHGVVTSVYREAMARTVLITTPCGVMELPEDGTVAVIRL